MAAVGGMSNDRRIVAVASPERGEVVASSERELFSSMGVAVLAGSMAVAI